MWRRRRMGPSGSDLQLRLLRQPVSEQDDRILRLAPWGDRMSAVEDTRSITRVLTR